MDFQTCYSYAPAFAAGCGAGAAIALAISGLILKILRGAPEEPRTEALVVDRRHAADLLRRNAHLVTADEFVRLADALGSDSLRQRFDSVVAWNAVRDDGAVVLFRTPR